MRRRSEPAVVLGLLLAVAAPAPGQEGSWTLSAGAGYALINFAAVKADMERDVRGYNESGYPIPSFPSPGPGRALNARVGYRFERDFSFSLSASQDERTVETSFTDPDRSLFLQRSLRATYVSVGLVYHFPAGVLFDLQAEAGVGMINTRATSRAFGTSEEKSADTVITLVDYDSRGEFKKSQLTAHAAVGGHVRVLGPAIVRWEAAYRFGRMGTIVGDLYQFEERKELESTVPFDYSGFLFLVSIGVELR